MRVFPCEYSFVYAYAGLSLFIINAGVILLRFMLLYAYNLTIGDNICTLLDDIWDDICSLLDDIGDDICTVLDNISDDICTLPDDIGDDICTFPDDIGDSSA